MEDLKCLKPGPRTIPHHVWHIVGRKWQQSSLPREVEIASYRGELHQVDTFVTRKPVRRHDPHHPFDKLSLIGSGANAQEGYA